MTATKTFETQFRINAVWAGQKGVQQAQRQMSGLAKTVQTAGVRVKGLGRSVFGADIASRAFSKAASVATDVLFKSVDAATEAQQAHDDLGLSIERNAKRYKSLSGKSAAEVTASVNESTQALIKASEEMERTGHDAETLQKGFARLAATGAMDPKQILQARDAFSDVLSYTAGANASMEESAQLGEVWADAILRGNIALLKQMDLTTGEIALFQNVNKLIKDGSITAEEGIKRRQDLVVKFGKKFEGETKRVFEKPSGKIAQMWTQVGNVFENLGQPFVDRAPEMAEAFADLAVDMKPLADEVAKITAKGLTAISDWFKEHGTDTATAIGKLAKRFGELYDMLALIDKLPVLFNLPKFLKAIRGEAEPARLAPLLGAPNQVVNPALAEGEAGRRYREAQAKAKRRSTPGYAISLDSENRIIESATGEAKKGVRATKEEIDAYLESVRAGGPSAMPGKITTSPTPPATPTAVPAPPTPQEQAAAAGAPTPEQIQQVLKEAENRKTPASFRNRNPGAQYPGESAKKFGTIGTQTLITPQGRKHYIAQFPTAVHGAAANFENLATKKYVGLTIRDAMVRWSGGYRTMPGPAGKYDPGTVITRDMVNDPNFAIPFMQAIASGEAPRGEKMLSPAQWRQAYEWYKAGKPLYGEADKPTASLRDTTRGLNRTAAAPTNVGGMTNNITVNGVQPGRESLMASKTAMALRDPMAQLLTQIRQAQRQEQRLGYV